MLEFIRTLKTKFLLYKKRRALGVFDKVKSQLLQFVSQASEEIDTRRSLVDQKHEQIDQFVQQKESEIQNQREAIDTVQAEQRKAEEVVSNLEQLGI